MNKKRLLFFSMALVWAATAWSAIPGVGSLAPDFVLPDQNGVVRQLEDYRGKWLIVYFYPKDDTPGCTTEAKSFRDHMGEIHALGTQVVGISMDSVASHKAFAEKHGLDFPLLADTQGAVAEKYGTAGGFGPISYAKRQTFLIDPDGVIVKHYATVQPESHVRELLRDLKAAQALYDSLPKTATPPQKEADHEHID